MLLNTMESYRLHHVGIAVNEIGSALNIYKSLFGYELDSGPFDDPLQNVSACFISRGPGDPTLEIVAPLGPNSPINRILKKWAGHCDPGLRHDVDRLRERCSDLPPENRTLLTTK